MIHHGNHVDVCATLFRLFHVVLHRLNRCEVIDLMLEFLRTTPTQAPY